MHHILGHEAARWAQSNRIATPEEFIARCDDPKVLLSAIVQLAAGGALSASDLQRAREACGLLYHREFPDVRTSDDAAVARLEKMLAEARDRYVKHVTAKRCNLLRAALPNLEGAVASAQSVGAVMARARKIADVLFGECEFTSKTLDAETNAGGFCLCLTAGAHMHEFFGADEPAVWAEAVAWLSQRATDESSRARRDVENLTRRADRLALAVQAPTDHR